VVEVGRTINRLQLVSRVDHRPVYEVDLLVLKSSDFWSSGIKRRSSGIEGVVFGIFFKDHAVSERVSLGRPSSPHVALVVVLLDRSSFEALGGLTQEVVQIRAIRADSVQLVQALFAEHGLNPTAEMRRLDSIADLWELVSL